MASLLKNQILKHLSKFTKNLSSDKINISTLKGEGELSNLELNEDVLTNLLELPTWLRITKAVCNRVAVKIQWTKLKSQPICLYLDEVIVETETCAEPRAPNDISQSMSGGKYGFVDRVMDGIYIHVNSVVVKLTSHKFQASLQLSRVKVQSMSPTWQTPTDLRSTRIRDSTRGEILLFKEIEWQTTRIEATAVDGQEEILTPLRLIANQAKIRIAVKKRLLDSAIISSRLILLLDDLLWVLTITQLKAAILYGNSLKELIERSGKQSKTLAAEKLQKQGHMPDQGPRPQHHHRPAPADRQESSTTKYFNRFDVCSTSYHLVTSRFDLHLCDDSSPDAEEKRHWKINGGSMQITFYKLSLDLYPFHPAGGERKSWYRYTDGIGTRNPWVQKLFSQFRDDAVRLRKACESSSLPSSSSAPSLTSGNQNTLRGGGTGLKPGSSMSASTSPVHSSVQNQRLAGSRSPQVSPSRQVQRSTRLLESCFVFKVEDMTVYMVNTPSQRRTSHQKLLASDKRQLHLPPDMSMVHLEFTDYFFPEGLEYPVPSSNLYILVNPIRITVDFLTLLWSNVFLLTLSQSLDVDFSTSPKEPSEHVDIKLELLMPRIIIPAEEKVDGQPDRPDALQLQVSRLAVSNCRTEEQMTRDSLQLVLDNYESAQIFTQSEFPCEDIGADEEMIPKVMYQHATDEDNPFIHKDVKTLLNLDPSGSSSNEGLNDSLLMASPVSQVPEHKLACDSLKRLASADIWSIHAEQVWLEFLGMANSRNRPVPFVEAVPVTIWISMSDVLKKRKSAALQMEEQSSAPAASRDGDFHNELSGQPGAASQSCSIPQSVMPTLGSSPPFCDKTSPRSRDPSSQNSQAHHIPSYQNEPNFSESNSTTHHHHHHQHHHPSSPSPSTSHQNYKDGDVSTSEQQQEQQEQQQHHQRRSDNPHRLAEDDRRPSRLSISGDGSRRSKTTGGCRGDSPFDERSHPSSGHGYQSQSHVSSQQHRSDPHHSSDRRSQSPGVQEQPHGTHRRQKQFKREDSRSSSSPPLVYRGEARGGGGGGGGRRREESKERRVERRGSQSGGRLVRQSSSSGSDRRDLEGGYRSGDGFRDIEGRSSAEGQTSSEWSRSEGERRRGGKEKRGSQEDMQRVHEKSRDRGEFDRGSNHETSLREVASINYRKNRQSSSSSSELGPSVNPSSSRDRQRSNSRNRRDRTYALERMEMDRKVPRDGSREQERDYSQEELRKGVTKDEIHDKGHSRSSRSRDDDRPPNSQDYDNDVGYGRHGGRRARDLQKVNGVSRSRESSQSRGKDREQENGRRRHQSAGQSEHQQHDSDSPRSSSSSRRVMAREPRSHVSDIEADKERDEKEEVDWRYSHQRHPTDEFEKHDVNSNNHCDESVHPYPDPNPDSSRKDEQQQQQFEADRTWTHHHSRPTPEGCRSQDEYRMKSKGHHETVQLVNKICVLFSVGGKVRIQISHSQYLFLMRLSESFAAFQIDLSADLLAKTESISSVSCSSHHPSQPSRSQRHPHAPPRLAGDITSTPQSTDVFIPLVLKEMELAVVCPYQMHQRTFSDDFSVISPFLTGLMTGQDAVFGEDGEGSCFPQLVDIGLGRRTKDDSNLQRTQQTISFKSNSSSQLENLSHLNHPISDSQLGGRNGLQPDGSTKTHPFSSANQSTAGNGALFSTADNISHRKESSDVHSLSIGHSTGKDSGIGIDRKLNHPSTRQHGGTCSGRSNKGASDMKKAFTSAFSSFTDKLKNKMEGFEDNYGGDDLDTMSIRTDTSDDDFEHMSLDDLEEVPAFFHEHPPPDLQPTDDSYSEIIDPGDSVSVYAESSTTKGKEMVYIVLFKLDHTEVMAGLEKTGTTARVQLSKLNSVQLGNISYDDFQTRFSSARGYIQEELAKVPTSTPSSSTQPKSNFCPIKLKCSIPAAADASNPTPGLPPDPGNMTVKVEDFSLQFKMSGLTCLSDFIEDEKFPEVMPMTMTLSNLLLVLEEDRPPANISSPGALPLNICIRHLNMERTKDGMMYISGGTNSNMRPPPPPSAFKPTKPQANSSTTVTADKPQQVNATTSPMPGLDGTMALLMASQNEAMLLRRQLEEVRRANRLYEHQILQWREMQDASAAAAGGSSSSSANARVGFTITRKRQSFTADMLTGSQSSSGISEVTPGAMPNHIHQGYTSDADAIKEEVERENLRLQHRVVRLEDDLLTVSKEKESLLQTLQLLQDELLASERKHRAKVK